MNRFTERDTEQLGSQNAGIQTNTTHRTHRARYKMIRFMEIMEEVGKQNDLFTESVP